MALLKLYPADHFAELDLREDSEVDAGELAAWEARGNAIRRCGFKLTLIGAPAVEWKPPEPKRYRRGDMSMGRMRRTR